VDRLPAGTVTFLFTDIEGSTQLVQRLGDHYGDLLADYRRLIRASVDTHGGYEVDNQGDAFFFAFPRASSALDASIAGQRAFLTQVWPGQVSVRARMGLHTGEPRLAETGGYVGMDVHRAARICHAGNGGQILLSDVTRALVEADLPPETTLRDLGEHRLKDLSQPLHLFQLSIRGLPTDFPPLRSLNVFPHNLPIQLTSFVGRDREVAEMARLVSSTRLVTVTGVGGGGKTRLALQVAAEVLEGFPDGVWLVELSALGNPTLIAQATASVLGVREQPNRQLVDTLVDDLRPKRILLLLDTCEHLLPDSAQFAYALLRQCPELRILATSREALGVAGETLYQLSPLAVPALHDLPSIEDLMRFDAVGLFVERTVARVPGFTLTKPTGQAVVQACQRLDGIPLAIELAAARTNVMTVQQIAARLDDRFQLLTGGSRTALPRHQTLRGAIDWSYGLLSDAERVVLRRVAVFAGGFDLDAAEAVCSGQGVTQGDVLDTVSSLVEKSLVIAEPHRGEMRYRLLDTVQQYAEGKLLESGESATVWDRHLAFYVEFAERAELMLQGRGQKTWVERLESERDNLRAAFRRSDSEGRTDVGLRLAAALVRFWIIRGYWGRQSHDLPSALSEGRGWLEKMLADDRGASERYRIKALNGAGFLAWRQGDFAQAAAWSEESEKLSRRQGDDQGFAEALLNLGLVARSQDDYAGAEALHEKSLVLFRKVEHRADVAWSLTLLGIALWYRGNYSRAAALFEESLALSRLHEHKGGMAQALHGLGRVAASLGDDPQATRLLTDGLALFQELGDQEGIASSKHMLGRVAAHRGDYATAKALLDESLAVFRQLQSLARPATLLNTLGHLAAQTGAYDEAMALLKESLNMRKQRGTTWDKWGLAECLERLAIVATAQGKLDRAVRLWGSADALRVAMGAPLPPVYQPERDSNLEHARATLGKAAVEKSWDHGGAMTLEQAIEYALGAGE